MRNGSLAWSRRGFLAATGCGLAGLALAPLAHAEEAVAAGVGKSARKRVATLAEGFLARQEAPGLSVAFARRGRMVYAAAFGLAGPPSDRALVTTDKFRIASVSKPVTAAAVMLLVERGDLALDDRVFGGDGVLGRPFPIPAGARRADWLASITVDHLLSHTAGGWTNDSHDPMFMDPTVSQSAVIERTLATHALDHRPGSRYLYSNFGYCLLGRVIEAVSGESYEAFVRTRILAPADAGGMRIAGNLPVPQASDEVRYAPFGVYSAYYQNVARMDAHGGWIASATDLVNFGTHVDAYKSVPDVLKPGTVRTMRTAVTRGYARGWQVNPQHRNRWHNGLLTGAASMLACIDGDVCFAGLVNSRGREDGSMVGDLDRLMWDICRQVIG